MSPAVSMFLSLMVEDARNYRVACFLHNIHTVKNDENLFPSRFIFFELNSSVSVKQLRDVVAARESWVHKTKLGIKEKQVILETYIRSLCMRIQEGNNVDFQEEKTQNSSLFLFLILKFSCSSVNTVGNNHLLVSIIFSYFLSMSWIYTMEYYDRCLFLFIVLLAINNSSSQILFFYSALFCFNNSLSLISAVYITWGWRYLLKQGKPTNDNILNI